MHPLGDRWMPARGASPAPRGAPPAAPMGGGVGWWRGETPLVQVTKKPQTFMGGREHCAPGEPQVSRLASPRRAIVAVFAFHLKKAFFFYYFFFPEATSKMGIWLGRGRRWRSAPPAQPCPPPRAASQQRHPQAPVQDGITGITSIAAAKNHKRPPPDPTPS